MTSPSDRRLVAEDARADRGQFRGVVVSVKLHDIEHPQSTAIDLGTRGMDDTPTQVTRARRRLIGPRHVA
jgi:hypothetical protein